MDFPRPIIIGHRGACGHLPEHTLASYALGIALGADFIEPDLVVTKDGALIARHENEIGTTTDVADKFSERKTRKVVDGKTVEGFFAEDLTLAEVRTLRTRERLPFRDQSRNGLFPVPTFQEIIDLVRRKERETGRCIGLYPETKHPSYFRSIGLALEGRLVEILERNGYSGPDAPVYIQSFEMKNLKDLRRMTGVPLIFLLEASDVRPYDFVLSGDPRTYGDLTTPAALAAIAAIAQGIGPWKRLIVPEESDKSLVAPTTLIADAHAAGLLVHPYTFRNEGRYLSPDYAGDPSAEYRHFFALGVDGVFSDFPDTAATARTAFLQRPSQPRQKV